MRLTSNQATLKTTREKLVRNSHTTRKISPRKFYLVAEPYRIKNTITLVLGLMFISYNLKVLLTKPVNAHVVCFHNENGDFLSKYMNLQLITLL